MKTETWNLRRRAKKLELQRTATQTCRRVSKLHPGHTFQIAVQKHASALASPAHAHTPLPTSRTTVSPHVQHLAKQLKHNLSSAMKKLCESPKPSAVASPSLKPDSLMPSCESGTAQHTSDGGASERSQKPSRLHHLNLLRQYLTFVAHADDATCSVKEDQNQHYIQLSFPHLDATHPRTLASCATVTDARFGAGLIEYEIQRPSQMEQALAEKNQCQSTTVTTTPPVANQTAPERRRPGRPPKSATTSPHHSHARPTLPPRATRSRRNRARRVGYKKAWDCSRSMVWTDESSEQDESDQDAIRCICDTPYEESGDMVQCDDCQSWLHMDCLHLDQTVINENFRCPSCAIALGHTSGPKMSSVAWRLAAHRESERLAAMQSESTSDEEEEPYSWTRRAAPRADEDSVTESDSDMEWFRRQSASGTDISSWMDDRTHHSETESPSEVSTPDQAFSRIDPFEHDMEGLVDTFTLDSESLELLSRLAYLESLRAVKNRIFTPNATDVFLCENSDKGTMTAPASPAIRFTPDTLPSSICPQELKEFSFDTGPFWKQMR